jgi:hypothetical protein
MLGCWIFDVGSQSVPQLSKTLKIVHKVPPLPLGEGWGEGSPGFE